MAAPEPTLRRTAALTAIVGGLVAVVSANAEGLRIGSLDHSFGGWQVAGITTGSAVLIAGSIAATSRFHSRFPALVGAMEARPHMLWLLPRMSAVALAVVVIMMAGTGLETATCPDPATADIVPLDGQRWQYREVVRSEVSGRTLVCWYGGGL